MIRGSIIKSKKFEFKNIIQQPSYLKDMYKKVEIKRQKIVAVDRVALLWFLSF
jgi:hypothetical protein